MADPTAVRVVFERQSLAVPVFVLSIIIVTAVLLWGTRILKSVLPKQDSQNPKLRFLDKAASEERVARATDLEQRKAVRLRKIAPQVLRVHIFRRTYQALVAWSPPSIFKVGG